MILADRQQTFSHAREVASERAENVHPVHVAEHPPLQLTDTPAPPGSKVYLKRPKRVGDAKIRKKGPPVKTHKRASIANRKSADGTPVYVGHVRVPGVGVEYIGRFPHRIDAETACQTFIETGEKPPVAQRGVKLGSKNQRKGPRIERKGIAKAVSTASEGIRTREPDPDPAFRAWRLEQLKMVARRGE